MKRYIRGYMEEDEYRAACAEYPEFIYYKRTDWTTKDIFKYKQKYLHEESRDKQMDGMYYIVIGVSEDGGATYRPLNQTERDYIRVTYELDVYLDGEVGFIWDGHFNHLGYLEGDQVVKGR